MASREQTKPRTASRSRNPSPSSSRSGSALQLREAQRFDALLGVEPVPIRAERLARDHDRERNIGRGAARARAEVVQLDLVVAGFGWRRPIGILDARISLLTAAVAARV